MPRCVVVARTRAPSHGPSWFAHRRRRPSLAAHARVPARALLQLIASGVNAVLAGLVAGGLSCWLVTPLDVLKSRIMAGGLAGVEDSRTVAALFRGGGARVLRLAPQYAITLSVFRQLKRLLLAL